MAARSAPQGNEPQAALRWCASSAPPASLVSHLAAHGLTLSASANQGVHAPTRVTTISHAAVRIVGKRAALDGRRIGVLHPDPGAADALAQTLRERGAQVAVLSLDAQQLARAVALDPEVIIVEPQHVTDACWPALEAVFRHPQLRWACVLVAAPEPSDGVETYDWPGLCAHIQLLSAEYDAAAVRARNGEQIDLVLEQIGPARVLRLLVQSGKSYRAAFSTPTMTVEIDAAEGIIVGARGAFGKVLDQALLGTPGLEALLNETSGVVRARPVLHPAVTNIMSPLDAALAAASHGVRSAPRSEKSVISVRPRPSMAAERAGSSVRALRARTLIGIPAASLPADLSVHGEERALALRPPRTPTLRPSMEGMSQPAVDVVSSSQRPEASASLPPPSLAARLSLAARRSLPALSLPPRFSLPSVLSSTRGSAPENDNASDAAPAVPPSAGAVESPAHASGEEAREASQDDASASAKPGASSLAPSASLSLPPAAEGRRPRARRSHLVGTVGVGLLGLAVGIAAAWRSDEAQPQASSAAQPADPFAVLDALAAPPSGEKIPYEENTEAETRGTESGEVPPAAPREEASAPARPAPESAVAPPQSLSASERDEPPHAPVSAAANKRAIALAKRGTLAARRGDPEQAKALYEQALALSPRNPRALWGRARIALDANDGGAALRYAERLASARPRSASSFMLLAEAERLAGDEAAARAALEKAAQLGSRRKARRAP